MTVQALPATWPLDNPRTRLLVLNLRDGRCGHCAAPLLSTDDGEYDPDGSVEATSADFSEATTGGFGPRGGSCFAGNAAVSPLLLRLWREKRWPTELLNSTYSGRLWSAPERLHAERGLDLIKSLNYVLARGGNPSPWRAELVDAIAGPEHLRTLTEALPGWLRTFTARYANQITATLAFAPAGVVFGYQQIEAMVADTLFEALGYDWERRVRTFEQLTRLNVRVAMLADRLPWSNPIREHRKKIGAAARERIAMLNKIAAGRDIAITFSHHDGSTSGEGFTG